MTENPEASVLTARRAPQHVRLFSADDAYEHLCILTVLPSLAPLHLMLADTPWPHGFGATLANVGPLSEGFERSVASPLQPRRLCAMGRTVRSISSLSDNHSNSFQVAVRLADYPTKTPFKVCIGSCFHLPSQVLAETELFIMERDKRVHFCVCVGLRPSCSGRIRMAKRGTLLRARHRTNTYKSPRRMGSYNRRICPRSGGPSAACGRRRRKTRTHRTTPRC